jgi:putative aldouronate transport system permease protein
VSTVLSKSLPTKKNKFIPYMKRYWTLYLLLLLPFAYFMIFKYIPLQYIQIAFKKYSIVQNVWQMPWADKNGLQYFIQAFSNRDFLYALRNTVMLNLLDLIFGFPAPIILALIFNELTFKRFKRFTQTVAYMPHFLSWVIIAGMAIQVLAPTTGMLNIWLKSMGFESIPFLNKPAYWVATYVALGIWKNVGWNTIIYLAAITNINPELYEAAEIDGAGRFKKMWHVTLPGLRPTIIVLLIMSLGYILSGEIDRPFALTNQLVNSVSTTIPIFVFLNGIRGLQFSLATAVGLFQSVVGLIFVLTSNTIANKLGDQGIM